MDFTGSIRKPIKNFGKNGAWAYPGTAPIAWVPPIISGMGKATNFKFYGIFMASEEKPIKNCGKSSRGHSQVVQKMFRALIYTRRIARSSLRWLRFVVLYLYGFRDIAVFVLQHATFPMHLTSRLLKIFSCFPGSRWMTFGLGRAKCSANCPCN